MCATSLLLAAAPAASAVTLPPGFESQRLAAYGYPTGLATTPDGRVLLTQQTGQLRVYKSGAVNPTPAIDLSDKICNDIERGLLGVAVGPDFADTHFVYLYYTYKGSTNCGTDYYDPSNWPVNRVSRFVLGSNDLIDPASETVLIDRIPNVSGNHNAGDLHFGKDGYLYVAVGDGGCDPTRTTTCGPANGVARLGNMLNGKILRIASDGGIPAGNPHLGAGTARCNVTGQTAPGDWCQEIYARGLRNPFRFAFDSDAPGTRFYINDVGLDTWDEIDLGHADADYGWNVREGHCAIASTTDCGPPPAGMTNPIFDIDHSTGCTSITAGAFVPNGLWPAQYDDRYLFGDFVCQKLFELVPDGSGGFTMSEFASDVGGVVAATFDPNSSTRTLYYVTWASPPGLYRISYTGSANRSPHAAATAAPSSGTLPLAVDFDGSASSDPDGDPLTYDWDFGDGSPHSSSATPSHTYTTAGTYTATLTVSDGNGGQDTDTARIDAGNSPPAPLIETPTPTKLFRVGEDITLSGSATDPEDGPLPASALSWTVVKHHATHQHPFLPPTTGNGVQITTPQPEDLSSATNSYLEISLTATDANGLSTTVHQDLRPHIVNIGLATNSAGLRLELNGLTAPASFASWEGWNLTLNAPSPQTDSSGQGQVFVSWSDGGTAMHTITTPSSDVAYTARFARGYARPRSATPARIPLVVAYRPCEATDGEHAAPLVFGSCSLPEQASDHLTVGTFDANRQVANATGYLRFRAQLDDAGTPQDESDVVLRALITDVRNRSPAVDDYLSELQASTVLRITDHQSSSVGLYTDTGTLVDWPLSFGVACAPTTDTTRGSTCDTTTSANAVIPGMVVGGERAIWELAEVNVFDGGADGLAATADNTLFETQGVFAP